MPTDFIAKPTAAFSRLADQATDASDFVNNLKLLGERNRNSTPAQQEPAPVVPLPADPAQDTCMRVIFPRGNNRVELYASSEEELDQKERQIRALFGGQR